MKNDNNDPQGKDQRETNKNGAWKKRRLTREEDGVDESIFEKVMPEGIKRGLESLIRDNRVKNLVSEIKLPREIVTYILSGIDETKQAAVGVVAKEVREFLENTNLADEMARLLTQISFEVSTQVRFVPSDKAFKSPRDKKKDDEPSEEQTKKAKKKTIL